MERADKIAPTILIVQEKAGKRTLLAARLCPEIRQPAQAGRGETEMKTGTRSTRRLKLLKRGAGLLFVVALTTWGLPVRTSLGQPLPRPLTFAGSGTNLPIIRALAEAFRRAHPDVNIDVPASIGSTGGIRAAAEGAIAVGLISRPLRDREKGLGLIVVPYARTAVVIGAHPTVADDGITFEDLVSIYRGVKSRWKDGERSSS